MPKKCLNLGCEAVKIKRYISRVQIQLALKYNCDYCFISSLLEFTININVIIKVKESFQLNPTCDMKKNSSVKKKKKKAKI